MNELSEFSFLDPTTAIPEVFLEISDEHEANGTGERLAVEEHLRTSSQSPNSTCFSTLLDVQNFDVNSQVLEIAKNGLTEELCREGSPSSKTQPMKSLTRGFMDDSDTEEPDIELVCSAEAEIRKMAMERALFGDSNDDRNNRMSEGNAAKNLFAEESSAIPSALDEEDSMSSFGNLPVLSPTEKDSDEDRILRRDEERESSKSLSGSPIKDDEAWKMKSPLQEGKIRKERFSKKLAMEEMNNLHKDTQRLMRGRLTHCT
jgi:hypothetical protein